MEMGDISYHDSLLNDGEDFFETVLGGMINNPDVDGHGSDGHGSDGHGSDSSSNSSSSSDSDSSSDSESDGSSVMSECDLLNYIESPIMDNSMEESPIMGGSDDESPIMDTMSDSPIMGGFGEEILIMDTVGGSSIMDDYKIADENNNRLGDVKNIIDEMLKTLK